MPTGPALRAGDMALCPLMDGPKPHVGGPITPAAAVPTVLIGDAGGRREHHPRWNRLCVPGAERDRDGQRGRDDRRLPAARPGDVSMHGTPIAPGPGCPTVIIGG